MTDDVDLPTRPGTVLALQYVLIAQAAFDVLAALAMGAYYGWAMTMAARVSGSSMWLPAASGGLPLLSGVILAGATIAAAYALSTRHPTAWLGGIGVCAVHLVLNPCCAILPLAAIALLVREDVREWLD